MPEQSTGEIQIGGDVPRSRMSRLLALLAEAELISEPEEDELRPEMDGVLSFQRESPGGSFYELEQFLIDSRIDFDRQASPSSYYDPEDVSVRDGLAWEASRDAVYALRRQIVEEFGSLRADDVDDDPGAVVDRLIAFVKRNGPVPDLRPFRIVEG